MSNNLSEIINRRKVHNGRLRDTKGGNVPQKVEEDGSPSTTKSWIIITVVIILIIIIFIYFWFWRQPQIKTKNSILEEMRTQNPKQSRGLNAPGTISLEEFRELESKFSMTDNRF